MNIVRLHQLIDEWAAEERKADEAKVAGKIASPEEPSTDPNATPDMVEQEVVKRDLPEGKRAVRTKTSGDRVYVLDDVAKVRQWVTTPEILTSMGFELNDVVEVDEPEFLKYKMGPAIYKLPDEQSKA